jgi:cell division protein FtsA
MDNDKIVVGLDIGTTKICVIVGRKNEFGKIDILGMGKSESKGVEQGVVRNIDHTVDDIKKALLEAEETSGIDIGLVNVGIAGQHIKSMQQYGQVMVANPETGITVNDVKRLESDMFKIVVPMGNKIIHVMPQEYVVDYEAGVKDPVGHSGNRLNGSFHIITAQINAINNIDKCIKRAGVELGKTDFTSDQLTLEPLASSLSVLSKEELDAGVCLVDIGGGTTDIAIFQDKIIRHTAVIPFGGDIITDDIKKGLGLMTNQAEQLKVKFGKAISEKAKTNEIVSIPGLRDRPAKEISIKVLSQIIEARMSQIIEIVHAELINAGYDKLAGGIVITGGGSQLQHVKQLFEYMTGFDTRIGTPNEHLGKCHNFEEVKSPKYATSVGLVLAGFIALDEREERYKSIQSKSIDNQPKNNVKPASFGDKLNQVANGNIFTQMTNKFKSFIMDEDLKNNQENYL